VIPAGAITVSDWADANRILSPEASAEPGRWRTARVPYARMWMDIFNDPYVHTIVLKTSSQVAKSETLNNVAGYLIDHDPCPILMIQPTIDRMKDYSKKRIAPMIRDSPRLAATVNDEKSRDSDNTVLSKGFIGGHLLMAGANAASGLASNPIRVVLADEVDRYPQDVDGEGDPLSLAIVRTTTFTNRKICITSTPTIKGMSRIEEEYDRSDKRRYFVPCPECGEMQTLKFGNLVWETDPDEPSKVISVHYGCEANGCAIAPHKKLWMLEPENGAEWIAERTCTGIAGFEINALYSVWLTWAEIAERFIKANNEAKRGKPELLKTFVNTILGECWDTANEASDIQGLENRVEVYPAQVPAGVLVLTAGVDTQPDRLEVEVVGWGIGEESWSIDYHILWGNTNHPQVWNELLALISTPLECEREDAEGNRIKRYIDCTAVDSGGHNTQAVYNFAKANSGRRVLAVHGSSTAAKDLIAKRPSKLRGGTMLYSVGTEIAKDKLFGHLKAPEPGEGYCHFPGFINEAGYIEPSYDEEYFKQLVAEKRKPKIRKFDKNDPYGRSQWVYVKIRARNEALDCRVYNIAALAHLQPNFPALLQQENEHCAKKVNKAHLMDREFAAAEEAPQNFVRKYQKSGGFVSQWNKQK
jgi:phage terminase large subunit GpA-like protein